MLVSHTVRINGYFVGCTGYVHDTLLQWAYGVNKTLEQGHSPDDGFKVTENILNLRFKGITGTVLINDNGDRNADSRYLLCLFLINKYH